MSSESELQNVVTFEYRNWKGITANRRVIPESLWFGSTDWHRDPQWLMTALDIDKAEMRDFAMQDITDWSPQASGNRSGT